MPKIFRSLVGLLLGLLAVACVKYALSVWEPPHPHPVTIWTMCAAVAAPCALLGAWLLIRGAQARGREPLKDWFQATSRHSAPSKPEAPAIDPFWQRMECLGPYRCQVLACTGSDNPRLLEYFDPPSGADLFAAFDAHIVRLWEKSRKPDSSVPQFNGLAIVAAGLLLGGQLEMADFILDHLPDRMIRNGYCNLIARRTVVAVLPLPEELREFTRWIEGTPEAQAIRNWVAQHRASLHWDPSSNRFVLAHSDGAEGGAVENLKV